MSVLIPQIRVNVASVSNVKFLPPINYHKNRQCLLLFPGLCFCQWRSLWVFRQLLWNHYHCPQLHKTVSKEIKSHQDKTVTKDKHYICISVSKDIIISLFQSLLYCIYICIIVKRFKFYWNKGYVQFSSLASFIFSRSYGTSLYGTSLYGTSLYRTSLYWRHCIGRHCMARHILF